MSIYRMNGKTKVAELTTQNVDWTTQINETATEIATDIAKTQVNTAIAPYQNWSKSATETFVAGYGKQWRLYRVGNIVIVFSGGGSGFQTQLGTWQDLNEVLPYGYRPSQNGRVMGYCPPSNLWCQNVSSNGKMQSMIERNDSSADYCGIGMWITNDSWPN